MEKLFIPYKLAIIAKNKGFDEPCIAQWYNKEKLLMEITPLRNSKMPNITDKDAICAPLYQQIVDWFIKEKKLVIYPEYSSYNSLPFYHIKWNNGKCHNEMRVSNINKAIEEAFKLV